MAVAGSEGPAIHPAAGQREGEPTKQAAVVTTAELAGALFRRSS